MSDLIWRFGAFWGLTIVSSAVLAAPYLTLE
jgi:hypothetical protein